MHLGDAEETSVHDVGGLRMVLQVRYDSERGTGTTVDAGFELGLPADVQVGPEGMFPSQTDLKTGDRRFDGLIELEGDPVHLLGRLSEPGRAAMERLVINMGCRIRDGVIVHSEIGRIPDGRRPRLFAKLAAVVKALTIEDLAGGLVGIALSDPEPGTRLRAASLLGARFPADPRSGEVGLALMRERDAELQMVGSLLAPEAGAPDVEAVKRFVRRAPPDAAAWAVRSLVAFGPAAAPALIEVLDGRESICRAAIDVLADVGPLSSVQALLPYTKGLFRDRMVKREARAAVVSVQERHGAADVGRLTVVGDASEGNVSLVDGES